MANTGIVANISQFNLNDDWNDNFMARLEQYFLANRVEDDRKVPVLVTTVSEAVYKVFTKCSIHLRHREKLMML